MHVMGSFSTKGEGDEESSEESVVLTSPEQKHLDVINEGVHSPDHNVRFAVNVETAGPTEDGDRSVGDEHYEPTASSWNTIPIAYDGMSPAQSMRQFLSDATDHTDHSERFMGDDSEDDQMLGMGVDQLDLHAPR